MSREMEAKLELTPQSYSRLMRLGTVVCSVEQVNVYYDLDWMLAARGATFRIRFATGQLPLCTVKVPTSSSVHGIRIADEIEAPVRDAMVPTMRWGTPSEILVDQHLAHDFCSALLSMNIHRLRRVGWVRNVRTTIQIARLGHLELDHLRLPNGTVVLEAEIEGEDVHAIGQLSEFVTDRCPDARPSLVGKFERFRRAATNQAPRL